VTVEQLMLMQAQLMQTMMDRLENQPAVIPPPVQVRDKRREFMKGCPPIFTHASDPLEADDWLRAVEKQLNIAQCNEMEKVLYASRQLQGAAQEWWKSYQYGRPNNAPPVTSREFTESFRSYHIPEGLIELKQEEVRALKQGSMTVSKYRDKFAQLSCYAPGEVAKDSDKQHHFLKGLYDGLQLQLMSNVYPSFQELVNRAIVIDKKRKEMDAKKRKIQGQASSSNTRPRVFPQQGFPPRNQRPPSQWNQGHYPPPNQNQNHQHPLYQQQFGNQQPQQQANPQAPRPGVPNNVPVKTAVANNPNACYRCGEVGHYAHQCPKK